MSHQSKIQFLLIEDDPDHAEIIRRCLVNERIDNVVTHVPDGESALAYLRKEPPYVNVESPELILLDLNMPVMDGVEVLEAMQSDDNLKDFDVVVFTGSDSESDLARVADFELAGYIVKPVNAQSFKTLLSELSFRTEAKFFWAGGK